MKTYEINLCIVCDANSKLDLWKIMVPLWDMIASNIKDSPDIDFVDGDVEIVENLHS